MKTAASDAVSTPATRPIMTIAARHRRRSRLQASLNQAVSSAGIRLAMNAHGTAHDGGGLDPVGEDVLSVILGEQPLEGRDVLDELRPTRVGESFPSRRADRLRRAHRVRGQVARRRVLAPQPHGFAVGLDQARVEARVVEFVVVLRAEVEAQDAPDVVLAERSPHRVDQRNQARRREAQDREHRKRPTRNRRLPRRRPPQPPRRAPSTPRESTPESAVPFGGSYRARSRRSVDS